jgi:hypothetical protein
MTASEGRRVGPPDDVPGRDVAAPLALAPGTGDATGVLLLRCLRTGSILLVVAGVAVAVATRSEDRIDEATSPDTLLPALATPLAVLAVGVVLRVLVAPIAYGAAALFVVRADRHVTRPDDRRSAWHRLVDRTRLAGSYRALRWTLAVRDEAVDRLGRRGRVLDTAATAFSVLTGVAAVGVVVAVALR